MRIPALLTAAVLAVSAASASSLAAQATAPWTHTTGLLVGMSAEANVIAAYPGRSSSVNGHVGGSGITLGYGITPTWAVYLNATRGEFTTGRGNTTGAGTFDLAVRYHFRPIGSFVVPFLQAGLSDRTLALDARSSATAAPYDLMTAGLYPALGAGVNAYILPGVALSASTMLSATTQGLIAPRASLGLLLSPGAWGRK